MVKIARKDKLLAGYNGNLESVIVHDVTGTTPVEITNGVFVVVEGLMEGQRETKKARLATQADLADGKDVLFVHNSEVMYDERQSKLEDFVIKAGKVARAYRLYDGDIVTLTQGLYADTVAVDDVLVPKTNGLLGQADLVADADILTTAKVTFLVIEDSGNELHHTEKAFAVQVVRN